MHLHQGAPSDKGGGGRVFSLYCPEGEEIDTPALYPILHVIIICSRCKLSFFDPVFSTVCCGASVDDEGVPGGDRTSWQ